jgi:hypothetical protein
MRTLFPTVPGEHSQAGRHQALTYPFEVREMALYPRLATARWQHQRSDLFEKQRNLMADWAKFTNTHLVAINVVLPMHRLHDGYQSALKNMSRKPYRG